MCKYVLMMIWQYLLFFFQLIKAFYKMTYLERDGIFTYYNPVDRSLYYTSLPDNLNMSATAEPPGVTVPEAEQMAEPETSNFTEAFRNPYLAKTESGMLSKLIQCCSFQYV